MKLIILGLLIVSLALSIVGVVKTTRNSLEEKEDGLVDITISGSKSDGIKWLGSGLVLNTVAAGLALLL